MHVHNTVPLISPTVYYAAKAEGITVVQTLHNYRLFCPNALFFRNGHVCDDCMGKFVPFPGILHACYRESRAAMTVAVVMLSLHRVLRTYSRMVDMYIALTEFARHKFIEGGIPAEKIMVKPNFLHSDPSISERDREYALFVGRLSPEKGLRTLLKAWQQLKIIPLKLVGDGPLMDETHWFVGTGKLECIEVLGSCNHEQVIALMKNARFLVFPSEWYETFGMTIIEAFACSTPVVTSRLGAMIEIVEDGRTGLNFDAGNPDDLAAKVKWVWTHPRKREEMGREARREYEEKYTAGRNYKILMDIYKTAIERSRKKSTIQI